MPAASNKTEIKSSPEAMDTSKQMLMAVDKKLRNLEKRKGKLDAVRSKQAAGETLEREQKEALQHYEEVVVTLEFIRELQKQFLTVAAECEKLQRKQAKREKQERAAAEVKRVAEILEIQATLDSLGTDTVREHFKSGKYGAVVLTEDNLAAFDELYQLISPSREGEGDFSDKLTASAEHILGLVEGRERAVGSTTYKELMELIRLVSTCGYFEKAKEAEAEQAEAAAYAAEAAEEVDEAVEEEVVEEEQEQEEPVADVNIQNNATEEAEPESIHLSQSAAAAVMVESQYYVQSQAVPVSTPSIFHPVVTQSQQPQQPKIKPLPEIMSAVRGKFSFLQDSEIELDSPQHVDPAVVAAQPMMRPSPVGHQQPPMMSTVVFTPASLDSHEPQDPLSLSQQSLDYSNASQTFAQSLNASGGLFQGHPPSSEDQVKASSVQPPPPVQHPQVPPPHLLSQSRGPDAPPAPFELPPSIPMPPGSQQQQESSQMSQEKKFQLNASATEFQSMYSTLPPTMQPPPSQPPPSQPTPQDTRPLGPPPSAVPAPDFSSAPNFAQAAGDFSQGGFQSGFQQRGGRGGPGGYRGQRGGRGGNNNPNMQNGFNPRVQNGNSRPGGNRGGQSFQGFPPRNDYRPDGFQGYNANGFGGPGNGSPYQKRGGAGGSGGFSRGGGGSNRGAGGMRGGPRASGPPRGAGGNRGGMSRPGNQ